jgi:addiction module RelE/StbE family toxin
MRRVIDTTSHFERSLTSFIKLHRDLRKKVYLLIDRLSENVFDSRNKTHSLSGDLKGMYSANIDHKYRIVFLMGSEGITLINIGSHDEVY